MKTFGKVAVVAVTALLTLSLVLSNVLAAYTPATGWTKYSGALSMGNQRLVLDGTVIKDGATYKMWFTRVKLNESVSQVIDKLGNLSPATLAQDMVDLDLNDFLNHLSGLSAANVFAFLNSLTTVIGYATSTDGVTWTIQDAEVLAGGTGLHQGVGTPTVIKDGTTYKMWYTRAETDLTQATLATLLTKLGGSTSDRKAAIQDLIAKNRTVIGYATSTDGINWTVQNNQVLPSVDTSLASSAAAPSVLYDGTTYRMWFTRLQSDLTAAQWATVLTDTGSFNLAAVRNLFDGSSTTIAYATSPDGTNWTIQDPNVLPGGAAAFWQGAAAPSVVASGGTYEMWYTRGNTNLNLTTAQNILTATNALGIAGLWNSLDNNGVVQFLTDLAAKDTTSLRGYLGNTGSVIGYATSPDGATWTVQAANDLTGPGTNLWNSVGNPTVVEEFGTYHIWYAEGIPSLTLQAVLDIVLGNDFPIGMAVYSPPIIGAPPPPPAPEPGTTDVSDVVSPEGVFQAPVEAPSDDGVAAVVIPEGTVGLTAEGEPLEEVIVQRMEEPPPPPPTAARVGLAYSFGPEGATFDPPVTITISYDPASLPPGFDETKLTLAVWDEATGEWVDVPTTVDTVNKTLSTRVSHFSIYAALAPQTPASFTISQLTITPAEVEAGEEVTVSVNVTNEGDLAGTYLLELKIDGVVVAAKEISLGGGQSVTVPFTVTRDVGGTYAVSINGLTGTFKVKEVPPPPPAPQADIVVGNLQIAPLTVEPGQAATVSVDITNRGDAAGTIQVKLLVNGQVEQTKTVTVGPGAKQTVTFSVSKAAAGSYRIEVEGLVATLTVKAVEEVPPAPAPTNWALIGGIIGGVVVVIAAVVAFILIRRRRLGM